VTTLARGSCPDEDVTRKGVWSVEGPFPHGPGRRRWSMLGSRHAAIAVVALVACLAAPPAAAARDIRGTSGPDRLEGTGFDGSDTIHALGGDDWVRGYGGHDRLFCGGGWDLVVLDGPDVADPNCESLIRTS
jgi:hypothetical protein